ncbi:hypothetical protein F4V45_02180 [Helicobacter canis]|uniref:Uncharacterized protein n=1 Tax=Helicobacter canis TaxID=29419 RepID=A0A5M9QRK9_9HELI|nr:hypothetical protein F4V45_02180 [Helicobacter canis]
MSVIYNRATSQGGKSL